MVFGQETEVSRTDVLTVSPALSGLHPNEPREIKYSEVVGNQSVSSTMREFFQGRIFGDIPKSIVTLHCEKM